MKPAEEYILNQPEPFKSILLHLQIIIESTYPELELEFKWKIPFYYLDGKPFCYLNPSKKKKYVDIAFWLSSPLTRYNELLISENRKVIKSLRYTSIEEIDSEILLYVLEEVYSKKELGFYKR